MKALFPTLVCLLMLQTASAQLALSFEEARNQGLDFSELDRIYPSGVGNDTLAIFEGKEEAYVAAYYGMLKELGNFLNENDFFWGGSVRCNNRIYFAADGRVDYYLYDFDGHLPDAKQSQFKELLGQFIKDFEFGIKGEAPFAQCSPVNYRDPL